MKHPIPPTSTGRIALVGDLFISEDTQQLRFSPELAEVWDTCHIRSGNLEAPLQGFGAPQPKAGPHLCQPVQAAALVQQAGFNLVNLANNHICDYGPEALAATRAAFRIPAIGAGCNREEACRPAFFTLPTGIKVGFLALGEAEFGAITDEGYGFAWVNHPDTNRLVRATKTQCDVLVVQVHAGIEQMELPLPEWRVRYRELIDLGADAVVGGHPHVPQGWETYRGKPIFYSLGNFFFARPGMSHPLWDKGLMVLLDIHADRSLDWQCCYTERKADTVSLLHTAEDAEYLDYLCRILQPEREYLHAVNALAVSLWNERYLRHYENAVNGVTRFAPVRILKFAKRLLCGQALNLPLLVHNSRIESHAWLVRRALNQLYQQRYVHGKDL